MKNIITNHFILAVLTTSVLLNGRTFGIGDSPINDKASVGKKISRELNNAESLNVKWNANYTGLTFTFQGKKVKYPSDMTKVSFPPVGAPPEFHFKKQWPIVTMDARWTAPVTNWPAKYRPQAIDLILMFACDAEVYSYIFPQTVSSSGFISPPEYVKEADAPTKYNLAESMRGKQLNYVITMKAGFGAADYTIKTKIYIGSSKDGKIVFYHDMPENIDKHLKVREIIVEARDAGDRIYFEARLLCVCSPAKLLKGERMSRVERDGKYFVMQMYEKFNKEFTVEGIESYLDKVKGKRQLLK